MNRRDSLIGLLAAAMAASSPSVRAQSQSERKPFVIALLPDFFPPWEPWLKIISEGLREFGHLEGRDYVFYRSGVTYGMDTQLALARVMASKADLILVVNLLYAVAAQRAGVTTPVVLLMSGFPVESGVAASLTRPGKNVTGLTLWVGGESFGKLVQLVHEAKPTVRRIGALMTYVPPLHVQAETDLIIAGMQGAASQLGLELRVFKISKPEEVDQALASITAQGVEALVLTSGASIQGRRKDIVQFAAARRLPTVSDTTWSELGDSRPMLAYAASPSTLMRQSVPYVHRILWTGAKPGDLPIQLPARFEFTVNLKTAKDMGLTIPPSILVRADQVIE
jgi:putative tryptophan/tyrosine transport system substrate-binding protein